MTEPDCQSLLVQLHAYMDGELEGASCAQIREHLEQCKPCLHNSEFEAAFKEFVGRSCKESAPPGLLDRMKKLLD